MRGEGANVTDECGALLAVTEGTLGEKKRPALYEPRLDGIDKTRHPGRAWQHFITDLRTTAHVDHEMAHNALKSRRRSDYKFQLEYRTRWYATVVHQQLASTC
jgi:hypothetical protein